MGWDVTGGGSSDPEKNRIPTFHPRRARRSLPGEQGLIAWNLEPYHPDFPTSLRDSIPYGQAL